MLIFLKEPFFYEIDGDELDIRTLSSGEREIVNIAFDFLLRQPRDCVVFFDEPELHLHPELVQKLVRTLRQIGLRSQFIFCTHSPDLITSLLDSSVIFIGRPDSLTRNQAIMVEEDDQTHLALRRLGHSIGILSLGRKLVLIEGHNASLDKQVYSQILRNRFDGITLVPSEGRGILMSFDVLCQKVLHKTIWGVEFFMLCDRDAIPISKSEVEQRSAGHLRVLGRYHLENYFLSEDVWERVFRPMRPEEAWLTSAEGIGETLRDIARERLSYATALQVAAEIRERVGNVDALPKCCHGRTARELAELFSERLAVESSRFEQRMAKESVERLVIQTYGRMQASVENDEWKIIIPGREIINIFAARAKMKSAYLKNLYIEEAMDAVENPFQEVVSIFSDFQNAAAQL